MVLRQKTSIGRLFLAGVMPGLLLVFFVMAWVLCIDVGSLAISSYVRAIIVGRERFEILPRVVPFFSDHSWRCMLCNGGVGNTS